MATQQPNLSTDIFAALEPISSLAPDQRQQLIEQSTREELDAGVTLFYEGEADQQAIYLLNGSLELSSKNSAVVRLLHSNSADARQPIANDKPRRFSAVTATPSEIIRIDKELLDTFLTWSQISAPEEEVVMCEQGIITVNKGQWLNTMIKSPTFRNLPPANIEALLDRLEPIMVQAGDVVIRQGDTGDYFYMIDSGVAMVTRNPDDDEDSIEMAELNQGNTFGEAALISNNPRNATVSMMSDGVLLRLSKQDFIELLKQPNLEWYDFPKAQEKVADGAAHWIDVRLPTEFQRGHFPGTINIPMRDLHKQAHALDNSVSYICYCETGRRSSAAAFVLKHYGLHAGVLQDGLKNIDPDQLAQ